jgi:hypothetical protein
VVKAKKTLYTQGNSLLEDLPLVPWPGPPQQIQERKEEMKIWRLCVPVMLFSGLCIGLFLGGCGDNPCDDGDPDTCANIPNTAPHACLVIQEEDFACLCCTPEASPCANPKEEYQWNELTHTCDLVPEE